METSIPFKLLDQANIAAYQLNIKKKEINLNDTLASQTGLSKNKPVPLPDYCGLMNEADRKAFLKTIDNPEALIGASKKLTYQLTASQNIRVEDHLSINNDKHPQLVTGILKKLPEQEPLCEQVLNHSSSWEVVHDNQFNIRFSSAYGTEITGYRQGTFNNLKTLFKAINDNDAWNLEKHCSQIGLRKKVTGRLKVVDKKGRHKLIRCITKPLEEDLFQTTITDETSIQGLQFHENARYSKILTHINASVLIADTKANIKYANPYSRKLTGYSTTELMGKKMSVFKTGKHSKAFYHNMWSTINKGEVFQSEILNRKKDGSEYWELVNIVPLKNEEGKITEYLKLALNITGQKKIEEEKEGYKHQLEALLNTLSDVVWQIDENGHFVWVSENVVNVYGYTPEEVIGTTPFDHMPGGVKEKIAEEFSVIEAEKKPFREVENRILTKNGNEKVLLTTGTPYYDMNGIYKGYFGVDKDVTEEKKKEDKIHELAALVNKVNQAIIVTNLNFEITYVNKAFELMYGYTQHEVLGQSPAMLSTKQDADEFIKITERLKAGKSYSTKLTDKTKNGRHIRIKTTASPIFREDGTVQGYLSTNADITVEEQLEKKADTSKKITTLGTIAGSVAHEFNNILQIIQTNTEVIYSLGQQEKLKPFKEAIDQAYKRAQNIVKLMFEYTRERKRDKEPVDFEALLKNLIPILKPMTGTHSKIHLNIRTTKQIVGYPDQLNRAIINLVENAIEAGDKQKENHIEIDVSEEDVTETLNQSQKYYLCLSVSDQGKGIPKKLQQRVFDIFYTTKKVGSGLGVGLSMVEKVVDNHQGFIELNSTENKGTQVKLYFPLN